MSESKIICKWSGFSRHEHGEECYYPRRTANPNACPKHQDQQYGQRGCMDCAAPKPDPKGE